MENNAKKPKKQRKLTKAEQKRKTQFEQTTAQMEAQGYRMHNLSMGIVFANVMAIILCLPIMALFIFVFSLFNQKNYVGIDFDLANMIIFLLVYLTLIVIHELIHGVTWAIFAENHWKSISFGFIAQYLTPYCTCNMALTKWQYIAGAIMPMFLLGLLPSGIAIIVGSEWLLIMGVLMILGAGGDLTMIIKLLRFKSDAKDVRYLDHPYEVGMVVFER